KELLAEDLVAPTIIRDNVLNVTIANNYRNLQVFNSAGDEVYRENVGERTGNRVSFVLPTLPTGPYYVRLVGTGTAVTKKFMISR
ncbi:MAG: T9SS type A sorting domain-containing protein, partial [Sphingobacteriales bacterium]